MSSSSVSIPLIQVDAFASEPFGGNPAAVCVLPAARDAGWMQHVAAEMNLSETAFLVRRPAEASAKAEATVRNARPDFAALRALPARGIMITSRATTPGWDCVSRFCAPGSGVDEDPVTGSAHCCLTPYWSRALGRTEFVARQLSARGGTLRVRLDGDRVKLLGQAVTVLRGELLA